MTDTQWTNWIEHRAGEPCPIPDAKAGEFQVLWRDGETTISKALKAGECFGWHNGSITHYRLRKPSPDCRALLEMAVEALREAKRALESCYQVADWPANGTTRQDDAINSINATLAIIKQKMEVE